MKLSRLIRDIEYLGISQSTDVEISGISYDSRLVKEGDLFLVWRGVQCDGKDFIEQAIQRGARALCIEGALPQGVRQIPCIVVKNARFALADFSKTFYGDPSRILKVIGVTGTNGKTTVSFLIQSILEKAGYRPGLLGTIYYKTGDRLIPSERTTPESLQIQNYLKQMVEAGSCAAVIEVSSHALHQGRTRGIDFRASVFTNLSQDHLDYHPDLEQYFLAKSLLFKGVGEGHFSVINADDPYGMRLLKMTSSRTISYGLSKSSEVSATWISLKNDASLIKLVYPEGEVELKLKLIGRFNVYNALAAFSTAWAFGVPPDTIRQGLEEFENVPGRMQFVVRTPIQVIVDYAHTENALQNVLVTLRPLVRGRIITVFGCGGDRDCTKRPKMGEVAGKFSDLVVVTTDNSRSEDPSQIVAQIEEGLRKGNTPFEKIFDRKCAIEFALGEAKTGDLVLIAGKGHEKFQEVGHARIPFDDVSVVEELMKCDAVKGR